LKYIGEKLRSLPAIALGLNDPIANANSEMPGEECGVWKWGGECGVYDE